MSQNTKINPSLRDFDHLPDSAYLRPQVAKDIIQVSIATFWRLVKSGKIKTYKHTERTTTVKVGDLRAFISQSNETAK